MLHFREDEGKTKCIGNWNFGLSFCWNSDDNDSFDEDEERDDDEEDREEQEISDDMEYERELNM